MAMALIHGGAAMRVLCQSVFNFLCGMKPCDIVIGINEVPSAFIREVLLKVHVYREVVGSFILTSLFV